MAPAIGTPAPWVLGEECSEMYASGSREECLSAASRMGSHHGLQHVPPRRRSPLVSSSKAPEPTYYYYYSSSSWLVVARCGRTPVCWPARLLARYPSINGRLSHPASAALRSRSVGAARRSFPTPTWITKTTMYVQVEMGSLIFTRQRQRRRNDEMNGWCCGK